MDQNAKQQAVEQIKRANNVLVTVSTNPSVDQLSAALGLTLMLTKLGKHTTAVVSGAIPPAISFLDPTKTFSNNVDSLRDFIIALDKDKADKLRYKVEDDVVKIFITPYDGEITADDLQFSQGDFNVDVVVALGVTNQEDLDNAIKAHGRILHDAAVITINAGGQKSDIGTIGWQDISASSICEMIVSVSEALQGGLLDTQIATALLTGIDAATDRFSNNKTSPKILTMAAQLMAAGANQQLIANNLEVRPASTPGPQPVVGGVPPIPGGSELKLNHGVEEPAQPAPMPNVGLGGGPDNNLGGGLDVGSQLPPAPMSQPGGGLPQFGRAPTPSEPAPLGMPGAGSMPDLMASEPGGLSSPRFPNLPPPPAADTFPDITQPTMAAPQPAPSPLPPPVGPQPGTKTLSEIEAEINALATSPLNKKSDVGSIIQPTTPVAEIKKKKQPRLPDPDSIPTMQEIEDARNVGGFIAGQDDNPPQIADVKSSNPSDLAEKPMLGGVFNATSEGAHDDAERQKNAGVNTTVLNHRGSSAGSQPGQPMPVSPPNASAAPAPSSLPPAYDQQQPPAAAPGIDVDEARKAVEQAVENQSFDPSNHPIQALNSNPMGDPEESPANEINIDPSGNLSVAQPLPDPAAIPTTPPDTQTLSIPQTPVPQNPDGSLPPAGTGFNDPGQTLPPATAA